VPNGCLKVGDVVGLSKKVRKRDVNQGKDHVGHRNARVLRWRRDHMTGQISAESEGSSQPSKREKGASQDNRSREHAHND